MAPAFPSSAKLTMNSIPPSCLLMSSVCRESDVTRYPTTPVSRSRQSPSGSLPFAIVKNCGMFLYCSQGTVHKVLCTRYCVQGTVYKVLYTRYCVQGTVHKVLCTRYCTQGTVYKVLYTRYCTQGTVHKVFHPNTRLWFVSPVFLPSLVTSTISFCAVHPILLVKFKCV